jgi:AraC-like DNA-binding protein
MGFGSFGMGSGIRKDEQQFPARYFALLVDELTSSGIDCAPMLAAAGIHTLDVPRGQLRLRQVERLLEEAERVAGRRDLGFDFGRRVHISSHDVLGYALITSASMADAFRLLSHYQRLINPVFTLRLWRHGSKVDLVYRPHLPVSQRLMWFLQEATIVSNHFEFQRMLDGRLGPYEVRMSMPSPPHSERYRELKLAKLHFGDVTPGMTLTLDARLLDAPLALADARAMAAAEGRCKVLLQDIHRGRKWSDWCKMMLRESEDCQPSLEELAAFVNISARTLGRYLESEGVSFRNLSLRIRMQRARQMLAETDMTVTGVAYRLGYSDVASFVRTFSREIGQSPGAYRVLQATGGDSG